MSKNANLLPNIKDKMNLYQVEMVDCFEKPKSIAIGAIDNDLAVYFVMYIKLAKSYYFNTLAAIPDFDNMIENTLLERFGIETIKTQVNGELNQKIKDLIDNNYPVVVPVNLRYLFYSEHYLVNNWAHLFVIKGYDEDKKIYHILDAIQTKIEDQLQRYNDFVIRYDDLNECYEGYNIYSTEDYIYTYRKVKEVNKTELLKWILQEWIIKIENRAFLQKPLLEFIFSLAKEKMDNGIEFTMEELIERYDLVKISFWAFVNLNKFKLVIGNELDTILKNYEDTHDIIEKINDVLQRLTNAWGKYTNRTLMKFYKIDFSILNSSYDEKILKLEDELHDLLVQALDCIDKYNVTLDKENEFNKKFNCHNNEDGIISEKNNKLIFNFNKDKCYNSWIYDDCPKVILSTETNTTKLSSKIKIVYAEEKIGFQAGLFIRNKNGNLFCWSIEDQNNLICDFVGKRTIKRIQNLKNIYEEVELFLLIDMNKVEFGQILDGKEIIYNSFSLESEVLQAGIMCKTWDDCKRLEVSFSEYSVSIRDNI